MKLQPGDHICSLYSTRSELVQTAAQFLAEGIDRRQRCWYVTSGDESDSVRIALQKRGVDVTGEIARGALKLISGEGTYVVHGAFDPEKAISVFNDAINQAQSDGYTAFRAAADMSWALDCQDQGRQVIVYEALLKALFASCRAIGLCLYDRNRMPLDVINGALATHPKIHSRGQYRENKYYDSSRTGISATEATRVTAKLRELDSANGDR